MNGNMKLFIVLLAVALGITSAAPLEERASSVQGFDISNYQPTVDFPGAYRSGARFVIIKVRPDSQSPLSQRPIHRCLPIIANHQATEGTTFIDPYFSSHYTGATNAGFIRGGYHFAHPNL